MNELMEVEAYFEGSIELVESIEHESLEVPCENKLGFTALCASCPLVSLFGECPKEVLNNSQQPVLDELEPFEADSLEGFEFENESSAQPEPVIEKEVPTESIVATPKRKPKHTEVKKSSQTKQKTEQPQKAYKKKTEKAREKQPAPSYLDLLLDDNVPVVVAVAFRPPTEEIIEPAPEPQVKLQPQPPVVKEPTPPLRKEFEDTRVMVRVVSVQEEPALVADIHEPTLVSEPEVVVLPEHFVAPEVVEKQVAPIEQARVISDQEPPREIKEYLPVQKPLKKVIKIEPQIVKTQNIVTSTPVEIIEPEQPTVELEPIPITADSNPTFTEEEPLPQEPSPKDEPIPVIEHTQSEQDYYRPEYYEEQLDQVALTDTLTVSQNTPEILTQSTAVTTPSLLQNIRLLLGSFVLKITL